MIDVRIEIDKKEEIEKRLKSLGEKANIVMARASNRAATTGGKVIKSETAKKYMVAEKDVTAILKVTKATTARSFATLKYRDNHKNLFYWSNRGKSVVTPRKPVEYGGDGRPSPKVYAARVIRQQGKKNLDGNRKPFVQIAKKSGNIALFRRVDDHSKKIEGVAGPSLPQVIKNVEILRKFEEETAATLLKRLEHEISHELSRGR